MNPAFLPTVPFRSLSAGFLGNSPSSPIPRCNRRLNIYARFRNVHNNTNNTNLINDSRNHSSSSPLMLSTSRRTLLILIAAVMGPTLGELSYPLHTQAISASKVELTDEQWQKKLSPMAYYVLRQSGTERPFTSLLNDEKRKGTFTCAGCDNDLFLSAAKYNSGTGWPSFYDTIPGSVELGSNPVDRFVLLRTEVRCKRCDGHLGHVFNDGPKPTGKRYCMNGVALKFVPNN